MKTVSRFDAAARLDRFNRGIRNSYIEPEDMDDAISIMELGKIPGKIRRRNPIVNNMLEVINQPYFDSFFFAAGAAMAQIILFTVPQGGTGQGVNKTPATTNMVLQGQIPAPQKLLVRQVRLYLMNNTVPADLVSLFTNTSFTWKVGKKPYLELNLSAIQAGQGYIQYSAAQLGVGPAGNTASYSTSNGIPDPRATLQLGQPILIEAGQSFSVILNPESAFNFAAAGTTLPGVGVFGQVYLDGDLYREVS